MHFPRQRICFPWLSEKKNIIFLQSNRLTFVTDTHYVYGMNCLHEILFFWAKRRRGTWAVRVIWTIPLVFFKCRHECNAFRSTPWSRVHSEKLTGFQLFKKFPSFYWTRKFITAFTRARYVALTWARAIQSVPPHATSWRPFLLLSSHLRLDLSSGPLHSGLPHENPVYTSPQHLICECKNLEAQKSSLIKQITTRGGDWPTTNDELVTIYLNEFSRFIKSIDFQKLN